MLAQASIHRIARTRGAVLDATMDAGLRQHDSGF